jgi:hypothetical protein
VTTQPIHRHFHLQGGLHPDIRSVCISDTHLGAENSPITNLLISGRDTDPIKPIPVLEKLAKCLGYLITANFTATLKPTPTQNGDILELALYRLCIYSAAGTRCHS